MYKLEFFQDNVGREDTEREREVMGNNEIKEKKPVIKWNHAVYYWNKINIMYKMFLILNMNMSYNSLL